MVWYLYELNNLTEAEHQVVANAFRNRSSIPIPVDVAPVIQSKNGYDQIRFKWNDGTYTFEARWHDATPNAPEGTIPNWRVNRTTPGSAGSRNRVTGEKIQGTQAI